MDSVVDIILTDGLMEVLGDLNTLENIQLDELDAYLNTETSLTDLTAYDDGRNVVQLNPGDVGQGRCTFARFPDSPPESDHQQSPANMSSDQKHKETLFDNNNMVVRRGQMVPGMMAGGQLPMYTTQNNAQSVLAQHVYAPANTLQMSPPQNGLAYAQQQPPAMESYGFNVQTSPPGLQVAPCTSLVHLVDDGVSAVHVCSPPHNVPSVSVDTAAGGVLPLAPTGYAFNTYLDAQEATNMYAHANYANTQASYLPIMTSAAVQQAPSHTAVSMLPPTSVVTAASHAQALLTSGSQAVKKRKLSAGSIHIPTPVPLPQVRSEVILTDNCLEDAEILETVAQFGEELALIKWQDYRPNDWVTLLNTSKQPLSTLEFHVDADKGFLFSTFDDSFVCQKKNHFQLTIHADTNAAPAYVKTNSGTIEAIDSCYLHFFGIKMEMPSHIVRVEQSQSDRRKVAFDPVRVDIGNQPVKVTVGRLHFCETTTNNMRKKGKPNPDQRYFQLVVALRAHCGPQQHTVCSMVSEKIIVRASNPGQFDNDIDTVWMRTAGTDSIAHMGNVGINTDMPDEALTVHGNIKVMGHIVQPSDQRVKQNIEEVDSKAQLRHITDLKIYKYQYDPAFAEIVGMPPDDLERTGVIAQEVKEIIPDAVKTTGDITLANGMVVEHLQVVDKDRIYMENIGAVKELCKVTGELETRILELEYMNRRLVKAKLHRKDSKRSTCSTVSDGTLPSFDSHQNERDKKLKRQPSDVSCEVCRSAKCDHQKGDKPLRKKTWRRYLVHIITASLVLVMAACVISLTTIFLVDRTPPVENNYRVFESDVATTHDPSMSRSSHADVVTVDSLGRNTTATANNSNAGGGGTYSNSSTVAHSVFGIDEYPTGTLTWPSCKSSTCGRVCCQTVDQCNNPAAGNNNSAAAAASPFQNSPQAPTTVSSVNVLSRAARAAGFGALDVGPNIFSLPNLTKSLDATYCSTSDCLNTDGSYEFHIPVAPNFPAVNMTLSVNLTPGLIAVLCAKENDPTYCSDVSTFSAVQTSASTFELSFAYYWESAYKIRVSTDVFSPDDVCNQPNGSTRTYMEYIFYFFRYCC